jgi:hypothetical protein
MATCIYSHLCRNIFLESIRPEHTHIHHLWTNITAPTHIQNIHTHNNKTHQQVEDDVTPQQVASHLQLLGSICSLAIKLCDFGFFSPKLPHEHTPPKQTQTNQHHSQSRRGSIESFFEKRSSAVGTSPTAGASPPSEDLTTAQDDDNNNAALHSTTEIIDADTKDTKDNTGNTPTAPVTEADLRRLTELTLDLLLNDILNLSYSGPADTASIHQQHANAGHTKRDSGRDSVRMAWVAAAGRGGKACVESAVDVQLRMMQILKFAFDVRTDVQRLGVCVCMCMYECACVCICISVWNACDHTRVFLHAHSTQTSRLANCSKSTYTHT